MAEHQIPMHYVCTHDQARALIDKNQRFWVSNCGCREARGGCARSRMDVCLYVTPSFPPTGSGVRELDRGGVAAILEEARSKRLVTRPFRGFEDRSRTEGICFCCDDCCGYFRNPEEPCDKGSRIERTDLSVCDDCGACVDACYFKARSLVGGGLEIDREGCFGCGLCVDVCPLSCIEMQDRQETAPKRRGGSE